MTAAASAETVRPVATTRTRRSRRGRLSGRQQLALQIICLLITATVLFPIL